MELMVCWPNGEAVSQSLGPSSVAICKGLNDGMLTMLRFAMSRELLIANAEGSYHGGK